MEKICCFFGHKDMPESVKTDLYAAIEKLIVECGVDAFYVGNQGHFDFYARAALRQSSYVIAYIHHDWGGAARYVQKAYRQGKTVINLCLNSHFKGGKSE